MDKQKEYIFENKKSTKLIIFIHGITEGPNQFEDFIKVSKDKYAIINLLLPGHGGTGKEFAHSSMKKWKEYIEKSLDKYKYKYQNIILVGHSMGGLLAMQIAIEYSENVKGLFLLAVPFCIRIKGIGVLNTLKIIFNRVEENNYCGVALKKAYSIENKNLIGYITWIPRYAELFLKSYKVRSLITKVKLPIRIYQSKNDEFISLRSLKYIKNNTNIKCKILNNSTHAYYSKRERQMILKEFLKFIESL